MDEQQFFTQVLHREYNHTDDSNIFSEEKYDDLESDSVMIESW